MARPRAPNPVSRALHCVTGELAAAVEVADQLATATTPTPAVAALQELLQERGLAAYIVPTADAHNSEYVADVDKRRVYISGFTGSAGTAVVLAEPDADGRSAYLWADSRYWLQAEHQLAGSWGLIKAGGSGGPTETPAIEQFLADLLAPGEKVGVDPLTLTYHLSC